MTALMNTEQQPSVDRTGFKDLVTGNLRQSGIYVAFVVIIAFFAFLTSGVLLSPGNLSNIVLQYSYILILAIGMVIVIIGGHIDLSVGSVVALTGAVSAVLVIQQGYPWWVGVIGAIVTGIRRRRVAGVLGRVCRDPGLHRHVGRAC
jgi:putative multiple sugar transport system permease protein